MSDGRPSHEDRCNSFSRRAHCYHCYCWWVCCIERRRRRRRKEFCGSRMSVGVCRRDGWATRGGAAVAVTGTAPEDGNGEVVVDSYTVAVVVVVIDNAGKKTDGRSVHEKRKKKTSAFVLSQLFFSFALHLHAIEMTRKKMKMSDENQVHTLTTHIYCCFGTFCRPKENNEGESPSLLL